MLFELTSLSRVQDLLREAHKEAAAERDAAAARQEEVQRCKAYIETVEAKLRVHGEYISQLETSLSDAQVRLAPLRGCSCEVPLRPAFQVLPAVWLIVRIVDARRAGANVGDREAVASETYAQVCPVNSAALQVFMPGRSSVQQSASP
jgi:hypothetical protein